MGERELREFWWGGRDQQRAHVMGHEQGPVLYHCSYSEVFARAGYNTEPSSSRGAWDGLGFANLL